MIRVSKFQRPSGYWYVRYWLDGTLVDESTRTKRESEAESFKARREVEINAGIQPIKHSDVNDLILKYTESKPRGTSASHLNEVTRILEGFLRVCGRKRRDGTHRLQTQQITPDLMNRYIKKRQGCDLHQGERQDARGRRIVRKKAVSNVTLRKELRYLSAFFNWCCKQRPRYLLENPIPLSNAGRIKSDAKPHFMITEDEFRSLLKACETPREYLFLLLGWWTGGRRSEILALHYYHFDFQENTLNIAHMKNNMHGLLPLSKTIVELVEQLYKDADEADRVFPKDPFPSHRFARLCVKAGVRHHRFHDFRISTSMRIKSGGFDASLAGMYVGNSQAVNQTHYTDLTPFGEQIASLLEVSALPPVP